ncbi:MAG TPA: hypothetical protein VNA68_03515 [Candidatus Dormibacteraeota bacterium]|nr:hypothetical protein [Candidatus Dormibacteraeota bacterium]
MKPALINLLATLPDDLSTNLEQEFAKVRTHFLLQEWDDLQIDAGRFCEAVLRVVEWKISGSFSPIDGKSKPNRKTVVNTARATAALDPTLRSQVISATELVMDFRNNRNSAHLGRIDPNSIDGITVFQIVSWIMGEIIRLESGLPAVDIQKVLDNLAERPIPIVYRIDGVPVVLSSKLPAKDIALVLLYDSPDPVPAAQLFKWSQYSHITRWRATVLKPLISDRFLYVTEGIVHILPPGMRRAEEVIKRHI